MRIAYCTNVRLPNERAHGHQVAKVTEAFRELKAEVEIFVPYRKNPISQSFQTYYGITSPVELHHLGTVDGIAEWWLPGIVGLKVTTWLFGFALQALLKKRAKEFSLVYTRTPELLPFLVHLNIPVILELHRIPRWRRGRFLRLIRSCRMIVALTSPMRQELIDLGVSDVPVIVEGDGVDLHDFEALPDPLSTRASLGVSPGVPLIVYAGQLQSMGLSKGIPELLKALEILKERGVEFRAVIAGGPDPVKEKFEKSLSSGLKEFVTLTGHLPRVKIPTLLTAADILVYPAPDSKHPYYQRDTSPLKLFEYMAAGKPIVCADLPPIHDAVNESLVSFFPPGDAQALAKTIVEVLGDRGGAEKKAKRASAHVQNFTWTKRMERILGSARLGAP